MSRDTPHASHFTHSEHSLTSNNQHHVQERVSRVFERTPSIRGNVQGANEAPQNRIPPSNRSKVKSSVQRGLRQKLLDTYPGFEPYIEEIMPKKASLEAVKLYVFPYSYLSSSPTAHHPSLHRIQHHRTRTNTLNTAARNVQPCTQ